MLKCIFTSPRGDFTMAISIILIQSMGFLCMLVLREQSCAARYSIGYCRWGKKPYNSLIYYYCCFYI